MAWLKSYQQIERHPKTLELANAMGWDIATTIGTLHILWWWCLDFSPTGQINKYSEDTIGSVCRLSPDKRPTWFRTLEDCGFIDKTTDGKLLIHDWLDYAGDYLRDTLYRHAPEKYKEIKQLYQTIIPRQTPDISPTVARQFPVDKIDKIDKIGKPDKRPTKNKIDDEYTKTLSILWNEYPFREGTKKYKTITEEYMRKYIKIEELPLLLIAVGNYKQSKEVKDGYALDAQRFIYSSKKKEEVWRAYSIKKKQEMVV
jgi:hypothetical protein